MEHVRKEALQIINERLGSALLIARDLFNATGNNEDFEILEALTELKEKTTAEAIAHLLV